MTLASTRHVSDDLLECLARIDTTQVRPALIGHVTEEMQRHYSTVGMDEKRAAIAGVLRLVPPERRAAAGDGGGSGGGSGFTPTQEAG